jgi:hypothetical protein
MIVLRTFSKVYGLAGLRIGYALGREDLVDCLYQVRDPFPVHRLAQVAAVAALDDREHALRSIQMVYEGKRYLYKELDKMGLLYVPSQANFVFIDFERDSNEIFQALLREGIIIRPGKTWGYPTCARATIGRMEDNQRFVRALRKILKNRDGRITEYFQTQKLNELNNSINPMNSTNQKVDLIIKNASELLTLSPAFKEESGLGIIRNGALAVKNGKIVWIGKTNELSESLALKRNGKEFDAAGKVAMPGLIDSHTHIVFGGSRENEFEQRIQGLSYLEIAERGGGILTTVEATRKASFEELFLLGKKRLNRMLSRGVTTIEAKSGYGLSLKDELKILKIMRTLDEVIQLISSQLSNTPKIQNNRKVLLIS